MSRRVAVALLVACVSMINVTGHVSADDGSFATTEATSDDEIGSIEVAAAVQAVGGRQPARTVPSRPLCSWSVFTPAPDVSPLSGGALELVLAQAVATDSTLYTRTCPNGAGTLSTLALVPNRISVEELISSAATRVRAQLPSPETNMSPTPTIGGIVNIGLWLSVLDPGQVSITASVGPVWATVTAQYDRSAWDFGNGDWIECAGLGTPIIDLDTADQGPCGYTYRWPSAPKFTGTDDLAYHASVTGHWTITYATSSGTTGSLDPITRTTEFLYQVREIQTVRVAEGG